MYEAVQDLGSFLHKLLRLLGQHLILQALAVQDQVEGVIIVRNLR